MPSFTPDCTWVQCAMQFTPDCTWSSLSGQCHRLLQTAHGPVPAGNAIVYSRLHMVQSQRAMPSFTPDCTW
ncbi:hypothetical protein DPMN_111163 [Dreissena polymorpha]|uniref:Uncharacterized protein n=1 Tax=Dreissena polymorpha TaxID=45954 RepID=A0A9D4KEC7_DREPO|nr:hypothetical protein DPMN_111163 [Dreissena polymorpha]